MSVNPRPKYSTLVKALKKLNSAINFGFFNALSGKEIREQPCYMAIRKAGNRAEKLIKRVEANKSH